MVICSEHSSPVKSIFEGATKYDILNYLEDARYRFRSQYIFEGATKNDILNYL